MIRTEIKRHEGDSNVGSLVLYKFYNPEVYFLCQETDDPFYGEIEISLGHFATERDALNAYLSYEPDVVRS